MLRVAGFGRRLWQLTSDMADSVAELFAQAEVFPFGGDHRALGQGFIDSWKRAKVGPFTWFLPPGLLARSGVPVGGEVAHHYPGVPRRASGAAGGL
jgi:hypothetical protein